MRRGADVSVSPNNQNILVILVKNGIPRHSKVAIVSQSLDVMVIVGDGESSFQDGVLPVTPHIDPGPTCVHPSLVVRIPDKSVALENFVISPLNCFGSAHSAIGTDVINRCIFAEDVMTRF